METMAPYLTVNLLGAVTLVFFFRQLMGHLTQHRNEEGYLLDFLLLAILMLVGVLLYACLHVLFS